MSTQISPGKTRDMIPQVLPEHDDDLEIPWKYILEYDDIITIPTPKKQIPEPWDGIIEVLYLMAIS